MTLLPCQWLPARICLVDGFIKTWNRTPFGFPVWCSSVQRLSPLMSSLRLSLVGLETFDLCTAVLLEPEALGTPSTFAMKAYETINESVFLASKSIGMGDMCSFFGFLSLTFGPLWDMRCPLVCLIHTVEPFHSRSHAPDSLTSSC